MGRLKSGLMAVVGAAVLTYTACGIKNRFSNENIFARMKPGIERAYKMDYRKARLNLGKKRLNSKKKGKRLSFRERRHVALTLAKERRKLRYTRLRADLARFEEKGASREERCKYVTLESAKLKHGSEARAKKALKNKSYKPFVHCKTSEDATKPLNLIGLVGGGLLAIYGLITFALGFRRREQY